MKVQQYFLGCLSHVSYLITDEKSHTAAVVDPQRDIGQYLADAAKADCTIRHVFLTHFHADFLAGHIELREKVGAAIYLGRKGVTEYPVTHVKDGGGLDSLQNRPDLVGRIERATAVAIAELRTSPDPPVLVDVRSEKEWAGGHIPGSLNLPLNHLRDAIAGLPSNGKIVVHCEGGYRSAIAASLLARNGRPNVMDLVGGFKAWAASQLPVEKASSLGNR